MVYENITDQNVRERAALILREWDKLYFEKLASSKTRKSEWQRQYDITLAHGERMAIIGFRRALDLVNDP